MNGLFDTNFIPLVKAKCFRPRRVHADVYPRNHNVRVSDHSSRYYLASYDVLVDDEAETVTFGSDPNETSVVLSSVRRRVQERGLESQALRRPALPQYQSV